MARKKKQRESMIYGDEAIEHIKNNLVPTCAHSYIIWEHLKTYLEEIRELAWNEGYESGRHEPNELY